MVIMMLIVVVSRYVFGIGQTGLQELIMYMHGLVFLASAGYLVTKDEHVRVDIFYRDASKEYKHKLNDTTTIEIDPVFNLQIRFRL